MKILKPIAVSILLFLFNGCHPVRYTNLNMQSYPSTQRVDIYINKTVDRDYEEIGLLKVRVAPINENSVFDDIRNKAMEIGADGIIIQGINESFGGIFPVGNSYVFANKKELSAIAIKYK